MSPKSEEGADRPSTQRIAPNPENVAVLPESSDVPSALASSCPDCTGLHFADDCTGLPWADDRTEFHHDPTCPAAAQLADPATPLDYFRAHPEVTTRFDADDWEFAEIMRWRDFEAEPAAPPRLTKEWSDRVDLDDRARVDASQARTYAENARHMAERASAIEQSDSEYAAHHVAQFGCSRWAPADMQLGNR